MQGRLQGKRLHGAASSTRSPTTAPRRCNYLLAVDVEMNTVDGYAMSSWERGYGDFVHEARLRHAAVARAVARGHRAVPGRRRSGRTARRSSPRRARSCARQLARLAERGWAAHAGTELEFIVFDDSYEQAWDSGYRGLTPANRYNVDYSMLGTARVEPLLRRIRNAMMDAGMVVEDSKGECNFGQHEINFRYADALRTADEHVIYKNGAKEIAAQEGKAITFMAKFDEREGNSCHIHLSLRGTDGVDRVRRRRGAVRPLPRRHARRPARADAVPRAQHQLLQALRGAAPSRRPTVAWGHDNRTCALRVVGHGAGRRIECRVPGADVNPYLAISALIAAGLHGVDAELELEPRAGGQRLRGRPSARRCPRTLRDARDLFAASAIARDAFGEEVVEHYLNNARVELEAFDAAVTDWERFRGFERL